MRATLALNELTMEYLKSDLLYVANIFSNIEVAKGKISKLEIGKLEIRFRN